MQEIVWIQDTSIFFKLNPNRAVFVYLPSPSTMFCVN